MALLILTAESRTAITDFYGVADLVELSNFRTEADLDVTDPGDIVWEPIERWASKCIAWFKNRGRNFDQTSDEVRFNVALFRPTARLSAAEQKAFERLEADFPFVRRAVSSSTSVAAGADGDRRKFSDDQLNALDDVAETRGRERRQGRGLS